MKIVSFYIKAFPSIKYDKWRAVKRQPGQTSGFITAGKFLYIVYYHFAIVVLFKRCRNHFLLLFMISFRYTILFLLGRGKTFFNCQMNFDFLLLPTYVI